MHPPGWVRVMYPYDDKRPGICRVACFWRLFLILAVAGAFGAFGQARGSSILFAEPSPPNALVIPHAPGYLGIGQAVADFDRDGWPDLYVTSGAGPNTLLRNAGGGFVPASKAEALALADDASAGALFFDYDNDGWPDLLVLGAEGSHLFRNRAGKGWADVTAEAGLETAGRGQSAAVADFDGDGWLDLYVVHWYFGEDESSPLSADRFFLNRQGRFEDISHWLDVEARAGPGFEALWFDYDNDGRIDLYVVNDKLYGNVLWRNEGPGCGGWCFRDVSQETGAARAAFSMGVSAADYDNDGDLDLFYSSIGEQVLLENRHAQGQTGFVEASIAAGVSLDAIGWGSMFFDADNDGRVDLYLATSNSDPNRCNRLWRNTGLTFEDVSSSSGLGDCGFGMGLASLDVDRDGRIDVVLGNWGQQFSWYRNESVAGRALRVQLDGADRVNRDAVGTRVRLRDSGGREQLKELRIGSGHGGNHEPVLHFGLGDADIVHLEVRWPDGVIEAPEPPETDELRLVHPHAGGLVFTAGFESS